MAGEVVEVGAGVKSLKAGDKVVAFLSHAVSIHLPSLRLNLLDFEQETFLVID